MGIWDFVDYFCGGYDWDEVSEDWIFDGLVGVYVSFGYVFRFGFLCIGFWGMGVWFLYWFVLLVGENFFC